MAIALSPNIYWYKSFGKLLFVVCSFILNCLEFLNLGVQIGDIWTGVLIFKLLRERHLSEVFILKSWYVVVVLTLFMGYGLKRLASLSACIWLFNPLTLTVSTRGNFEAVLAVYLRNFMLKYDVNLVFLLQTIVVGILYCVEKRKYRSWDIVYVCVILFGLTLKAIVCRNTDGVGCTFEDFPCNVRNDIS